nr:hypothetical protein Iba_chr09aCG5590 [Ipomoea batatas]
MPPGKQREAPTPSPLCCLAGCVTPHHRPGRRIRKGGDPSPLRRKGARGKPRGVLSSRSAVVVVVGKQKQRKGGRRSASPLQLPLGRTEEGDGGVGAARVLRHLNAATLFCRCRRSFEERVEEAAATVDGAITAARAARTKEREGSISAVVARSSETEEEISVAARCCCSSSGTQKVMSSPSVELPRSAELLHPWPFTAVDKGEGERVSPPPP